MTVSFGWSHVYTYLFGHICLKILKLPDIVQNDIFMAVNNSSAFYVFLFVLNIQYITLRLLSIEWWNIFEKIVSYIVSV